jgi:hypothetical protein
MGRAALRGAPHQPPVSTRVDVLGAMERLQLQESEDVQPNKAVIKNIFLDLNEKIFFIF